MFLPSTVRKTSLSAARYDVSVPASFELDFEVVAPQLTTLPSPSAEELAALLKARVLLVDDDPALLNLYQKFLVRAGFEVSTATNGKVGFEKKHRRTA